MTKANIDEKEIRIDKWAAINGKWTFTKDIVQYLGPTPDQPQPVGLARASVRFRDGLMSSKVTLSRKVKTSAGFFVRFQSPESAYAVASIGGWERAYAIGEYQPGIGWYVRSSAGSLSNLNIDEPHEIKVTVIGQAIRLVVDDVEVLSTAFSIPLEGTGFGLFTFDDAKVDFTETKIIANTPKIFVMMPFDEPFNGLYHQVINPVATRLGFDVVRVDDNFPGTGLIIGDIQRQIETAHAVVAEISTQNPNVFYELGYAHALHKPAILLVRRSDSKSMPFDISGYRAIHYDDSIIGKNIVEKTLQQHLSAILGA